MLFSAILFFSVTISTAQISDKVAKISPGEFHPGESLNIQVELINATAIDRVELAYRSFGQSDYKRIEMHLQGNIASSAVPSSDLTLPFLEYYLTLYLRSSAQPETYPLENPREQPLKIDLQSSPSQGDESIIVMSPEQNETVLPDDIFISFSLLRADSTVDRSAVKTYLDDADISLNNVVSDNLVIVAPPTTLNSGKHAVRVELFDRQGKSIHSTSWTFNVKEPATYVVAPRPSSTWIYTSSLQAETRNENIFNSTTPYNRLSLTAGGAYDQFRINGLFYVTNEETDKRQPQNRFFIDGESPWLKIGYGDHYPIFPDLIMTGRRVRGFMGNLTLGVFNLDVSIGDILRNIQSDTIKTFAFDSLAAEQSRDNAAAYGPYDQSRWAKFKYGTYTRDLFVIRPSFGKRNGAHLGFTYLKSKDDLGSVRYGSKPQENLVIGSDLLIPYDNHNVEITGQAAFSATNTDITSGTFSDARIDSIFSDYSESSRNTIRRVRDIFSRFITVNENLIPLNLKNTPTLAYEAGLALNYFGNYLKFTYLRHGNNFESFGQLFVRPDIVGFNIVDHLRLAANQVLLSGGFEHLQDNTAETKPSTTTSTTTNLSLSWYPKTEAPNITLAYLFASNMNSIPHDTLWGIDDHSNRFLIQLGKEFALGPRHNAVLSISTSSRDDQTIKNLDTKNTTVSFSNTATFLFPLQILVSLNVSTNTFSMLDSTKTPRLTTTNYTTLYANAQYKLIGNKLILNGAISPTLGDIERTLIDTRAQYFLYRNLSLMGQLSLYLNKNTTNDVIWSFILRADV